MMAINKDLMAASSTPIVLAILAEGDSYGYAILQRVRELSGGRMEWTDGMLYPVLHRLGRRRHVEGRVGVGGARRAPHGLPRPRAGPGAARRGAPPVAGGGRDAPGDLAGDPAARPGWSSGIRPAAATGKLRMPTPAHAAALEEQIAQWR